MAEKDTPEEAALRKKLVFRRGTEEDYQAVLDINKNLYGGWDYIPALYHKYVKDPKRVTTLAVLDGKVVSATDIIIYSRVNNAEIISHI